MGSARRRRMMGWLLGIPFTAVILIAVIWLLEPEREGISRASACRAAALLTASAQQCREEAAGADSYFPAGSQDRWYAVYMDCLYRRGWISQELTPADEETAEGFLTYEEADYLAAQAAPELEGYVGLTRQNRDRPIPEEQWWYLYDAIRQRTENCLVTEETLQIFGTPDNVEDAPAWTAYTNRGSFGFEGLALSPYIDREIRVLVSGQEILRVAELVSDQVTYKNVWIFSAGEEAITGYVGAITRRLPVNKTIDDPEAMTSQLADVTLKAGTVEKVVLKKDTIHGKILSVREDSIEIEGYGQVPLDENFGVYKLYGEFRRQSMSELLVGYDSQEFVTADGKLCAALTVREFDADTIRVLIMSEGFGSLFHDTVELEFLSGGTRIIGEEEQEFFPGETVTLSPGDPILQEGRVIYQPEDPEAGIRVRSLERSQGMPVYPGRLEITEEDGALVLINETYVEDYLKRVVPSEMPASYEKEALKAQAVCARTYAYRQIQGNSYRQYGAHVDDSTNFQVYNNIQTYESSNVAVNETYGKLLFYEGEAAEVFYFSTSCGHTTDGTIWGADLSDVPYLKGTAVREGGGVLDLTSNVVFSEYIKSCPAGYESGFPMYRWQTQTTSSRLEEEISDIGTITKITMRERSAGGIGMVMEIEGTGGVRTIQGESRIRSVLGHPDLVITRQDGTTVSGWDSLPSAFIAVERSEPDENGVTVFTIYGGGYGHGVGMSQNGAQGMAQAGMNYKEILEFFFDGITIEELL